MFAYEWEGYDGSEINFKILDNSAIQIYDVMPVQNVKEYNAYKYNKQREHSARLYELRDKDGILRKEYVQFPLSPKVNNLLLDIKSLSKDDTISENPPLDQSKPWIKIIGDGKYLKYIYNPILSRWQIVEKNKKLIYINCSEVDNNIQNYIGIEGQLADYKDIDNKIHEYIYINGIWYPTAGSAGILAKSCEDGDPTTVDLLVDGICESLIASCKNGFSGTVNGSLDGDDTDNALNCSSQDLTDEELLNYINLVNVSDDLWLFNNNLTNLDGLSNLETIDGSLVLMNNYLTNIDGLSNLISVNGSLVLDDNSNLTNLDSLSNLIEVTDGISLNNDTSLENLDGLSSLTTTGIFVADNTGITNVDGLLNLTETTDYFSLSDNPFLTNVDGLSNLTSIGSDLWLEEDSSLTNIDGLSNIKNIDGSIILDQNNNLENIDGLSGIKTINGVLKLKDNYSLTNIDGLSNVTQVNNIIELYNVPNLTDISGLSNAVVQTNTTSPVLYIEDQRYTTKMDTDSPICVGARDGTVKVAIVTGTSWTYPSDTSTGYDFMCN
jgi:hypothetical protein